MLTNLKEIHKSHVSCMIFVGSEYLEILWYGLLAMALKLLNDRQL